MITPLISAIRTLLLSCHGVPSLRSVVQGFSGVFHAIMLRFLTTQADRSQGKGGHMKQLASMLVNSNKYGECTFFLRELVVAVS